MMKIRQGLLFFVFLTVFFFGMGHAWAGEIIKLAVETKPGSAQNICADEFRKLLESRSNYKVRLYQGTSLGTETDILKKIQADEVQMGVITSAPFDAFLPDVHVLDYPFLFANYDQVDLVLDGAPGQELLKRLEKAGFKGLAYAENGFRNLTNNQRSVHRVEDVAGLKIRVMESAVHSELWKMLGAVPVSMGWPGVVTALKEKSVDGQENPLSVVWSYKLYESQKYLSLTKHVYSPHIAVANLKWFEGIPEADRKLIRQCMQEAALYQRHWNRKNMADFLENLKRNGMIINETPDVTSFRNQVADIQNHALFQCPGTQELLKQFMEAVK